MTVHPYFTARAAEWMRSAGGDPAVVDMTLGAIRRAVGQPVAHCKFSEVCVGAAAPANPSKTKGKGR